MAGRLILDSFSPVLDDDGNPISGAKLHFRDAGTTDPKTVYLTMALDPLHVHTNPILTDAAGRLDPHSMMWAADGEGYDVLITDADDEEIRVLEDIYALTTTDPDTTTGGTVVQVNTDNTVGKDVLAVAFRADLDNDITVTNNNGFGNNGGWYLTFENAALDTHDGLNLSYAYGVLDNASVQDEFYSPSTAFICPEGMGGLWSFRLSIYLQDLADAQNVFSCGLSVHDADGTASYQQPGGSDYQNTYPSLSLAPDTGIFDNGFNITGAWEIELEEGQFVRPWFIRGDPTAGGDITISSSNTWWVGHRIGALA